MNNRLKYYNNSINPMIDSNMDNMIDSQYWGNSDIQFPNQIDSCVLSLIANKANKGQVPSTSLKTWSDQNVIKNIINYTNALLNPGFENNFTSWGGQNGTPTIDSVNYKFGTKSLNCNSTGTSSQVNQIISCAINDKFYVSAYSKCTRYVTGSIGLSCTGTITNSLVQSTSILADWVRKSTITVATTTNIQVYAGAFNTANLDGNVDGILVINLTTLFGAGNEPDIYTCDRMFSYADSSTTSQTINYINRIAPYNINFSATTGYTGDNASLSVNSGKILCTGSNTKSTVGLDVNRGVNSNITPYVGQIMYVKIKATVPSGCTSVTIGSYNGTTQKNVSGITPTIGTPTYYSGVLPAQTDTGSGNLGATFRAIFPDSATANGKIVEVLEVMMIDLTALGLDSLNSTQSDDLFAFVTFIGNTIMNNDFSVNNTAGTVSSGFNSETNSTTGKLTYFLTLDGTDDFGAIANFKSLDITNNEFAICATFKILTASPNGYIICKNLDASTNTQYGLLYSGGKMYVSLNGASDTTTSMAVSENIWYHVIFYRNSSGFIRPYLNKVLNPTTTVSGVLVSRPYVRLGARSNNSSGTPNNSNLKANISTVSIYQAPTLDINKIIKAEMNISKNYTGVS